MIQPKPLPRREQRQTRRYLLPRRTVCRLTRAIGGGPWPALVRNISADGIGLLLRQPVKPGMLLTVELTGKDQKTSVLKAIKVTHAAVQGGTPWFLAGGRFASRLTDAEMRNLLAK